MSIGYPPSLVRPDCQLVATWVSELKPSPTGETENLLDDLPAEGLHLLVLGLEVARIHDHQGGTARLGLPPEAAPDRPGLERRVIGAIVCKPPAKDAGVEFLDELKVRRPKFDVLDSVVTFGIAHHSVYLHLEILITNARSLLRPSDNVMSATFQSE